MPLPKRESGQGASPDDPKAPGEVHETLVVQVGQMTIYTPASLIRWVLGWVFFVALATKVAGLFT